ncbi:hypothetical protein GOP47_0013888 [Adiantum capillus-veneris]|uniref:Uncharacterized protein n=1 Tax=Adiantum capillus-veneris TaxID=13818 RepID=A0A9D4UQC3_ADICA|nr:hypothetical protein GOP47_0013888 [Adiantum capillus-veneris]
MSLSTFLFFEKVNNFPNLVVVSLSLLLMIRLSKSGIEVTIHEFCTAFKASSSEYPALTRNLKESICWLFSNIYVGKSNFNPAVSFSCISKILPKSLVKCSSLASLIVVGTL